MAWVYNPDDEPDSCDFNGLTFALPANTAVEIVSPWERRLPHLTSDVVADHIVSKLGQWGVVKVSGPVTNGHAFNADDQKLVDEAERVYLAATKAWAEHEVIEDFKANAPRTNSGLPPKTNAGAKKAKQWLQDNADRLLDAE